MGDSETLIGGHSVLHTWYRSRPWMHPSSSSPKVSSEVQVLSPMEADTDEIAAGCNREMDNAMFVSHKIMSIILHPNSFHDL